MAADLPTVIIDTREQDPLEPFLLRGGQRVYLPTERRKLDVGDYALAGGESYLMIERKSVPDLYGTLFGSGRTAAGESSPNLERFRAELLRAQDIPRRYVLIEGGWPDLEMMMVTEGRRMTPPQVNALVTSLALDYDISFVWATTGRLEAAWWLGFVLQRVHEQMTDVRAAAKAHARELKLPWLKPEEP
jgi:ERCC4-type nuclease